MQFPHGQTVYRDRPKRQPDRYNPSASRPTTGVDTITIENAFVASSSSRSLKTAARNEVLTSKSLYCAPGVDVKLGDIIRVGSDKYTVDEVPAADTNPFTGWQPVVEIPLTNAKG